MTSAEDLYDVAVIGGGPAGLTAAIYLARARFRVVVVEREKFGGQITITSEVVNYPGVLRTDGGTLTETMRRQAESFGAEFMLAAADSVDVSGDIKVVHTSRGDVQCLGIVVATGASPRKVGFDGEEEFKGRGVAYCATCDGEFFAGKEVFVVGVGFAAAEEGVFLTKYASHVTILIRGDDFKCAQSAADAARSHEKITVLTNTSVDYVRGDAGITEIKYTNSRTGESVVRNAPEGSSFGVFVFAGRGPSSEVVKGIVDTDGAGYIVTDANRRTSVEGVYAAGDICIKNLRQVVTATADGAIVATELEKYLALMHEKTGLRPVPKAPAQKAEPEEKPAAESGGLFSEEILEQLETVFSRMERNLVLEMHLDGRPVSGELRQYMEGIAELTPKVTAKVSDVEVDHSPCVRVCLEDGTWTGLAFHGVPGGHEFTSFVLGLYNASGPGQAVDPAVMSDIMSLGRTDMKVLVSLTCTMCPELVTAAQRIAAANPEVTAEVYDLNHFEDLREKYNVMSVPCLVVGDRVDFGKKNVAQLVEFLKG